MKINPSLNNIVNFLQAIKEPHHSFKAIQIAGTNGKGSVCTFLELMFLNCKQNLGLRQKHIGKYISPHLVSVCERISVNGVNISEFDFLTLCKELFNESYDFQKSEFMSLKSGHSEALGNDERLSLLSVNGDSKNERNEAMEDLYCKKTPFSDFSEQGLRNDERLSLLSVNDDSKNERNEAVEDLRRGLTEFEKLTVIAFEYFKRQNIDLAILEVGLGGKWDATNCIAPKNTLATAITNISMDHMDYLGNSLEEIRQEKEGIIKQGVTHYDGGHIFSTVKVKESNDIYSCKLNGLNGKNFLLAKKIFEDLNSCQLDIDFQRSLIEEFSTKYRARLDYNHKSNILIDGAHNPAAAIELREFVNKLSINKKIYILGFLDKDYQSILENLFQNSVNGDLSKNSTVIFTKVNNSRSTEPSLLSKSLQKIKSDFQNIILSSSLEEAIEKAYSIKNTNDLLIISGSLYLAGEYYAGEKLFNKA